MLAVVVLLVMISSHPIMFRKPNISLLVGVQTIVYDVCRDFDATRWALGNPAARDLIGRLVKHPEELLDLGICRWILS